MSVVLLEVSDRIATTVTGDASVLRAVRSNEAYVAGETLTSELRLIDGPADEGVDVGDAQRVTIAVVKVDA